MKVLEIPVEIVWLDAASQGHPFTRIQAILTVLLIVSPTIAKHLIFAAFVCKRAISALT
jgi:hypothetical protein